MLYIIYIIYYIISYHLYYIFVISKVTSSLMVCKPAFSEPVLKPGNRVVAGMLSV